MKNIILVTALLLFSTTMFAQATWENNDPNANSPLGYLGWDDNTNTFLDVKQNDLLRMRFRGIPYSPIGGPPAGLGGSNYTSASRIILDVEGNNTFNVITVYSISFCS